MKALGTGWAQGIGFLQVEVYRRSSGAPSLRLHGEAQRRAEALGVEQLWLSISLDGPTAELHDGFRQVQGTFDMSMRALGWARRVSLRKSCKSALMPSSSTTGSRGRTR